MVRKPRTGFEQAELVDHAVGDEPGRRELARTVAGLAAYLAPELRGHPEREAAAMGALADWCEHDTALLARARAEARRDETFSEAHREAVSLVRRTARAS